MNWLTLSSTLIHECEKAQSDFTLLDCIFILRNPSPSGTIRDGIQGAK